MLSMNISSISSSLLTSLLANNATATSSSSSKVDLSSLLGDSTAQVSDIGMFMSKLQELQKSDPDKFKQIMAKIAEKLKDAASEALKSGDSRQAEMLNDLAAKFTKASETGEMPDLKPPQRAGGPPPGPLPDVDTGSSTSTSTTGLAASAVATQYQSLLAMLQQNSATDPMSTLSGILRDIFTSAQS